MIFTNLYVIAHVSIETTSVIIKHEIIERSCIIQKVLELCHFRRNHLSHRLDIQEIIAG